MWDPYRRSYRLPPSQRPTLLWTACSKLRPRKLRSTGERSIVCTVHTCKYSTSTFDIRARAWRVHSRAPPTTLWWATRAVGEIKFGQIFVPIQGLRIKRNFYPAKILCCTSFKIMYWIDLSIQPSASVCVCVHACACMWAYAYVENKLLHSCTLQSDSSLIDT